LLINNKTNYTQNFGITAEVFYLCFLGEIKKLEKQKTNKIENISCKYFHIVVNYCRIKLLFLKTIVFQIKKLSDIASFRVTLNY